MENNNKYTAYYFHNISVIFLLFTLMVLVTACSSGDDGENQQKPELVQTPSVIGNSETAALDSLNELDLEVAINRVNANAPIGEVLEQDPPAGQEIEVGQSVTITVSDGIVVPNVVGMNETDAIQLIQNSDLIVAITYQDSIAPIGEVISQALAADSNVDPGAILDVVISGGVPIPNVVGLTVDQAVTELTNWEFTVNIYRVSNITTIDQVISQSLTPGSRNVNSGTTIDIFVSNGVIIPNVVGLNVNDARPQLENLGLSVVVTEVYDPAQTNEQVAAQSPESGTVVSGQGRTVDLQVYISSGPVACLQDYSSLVAQIDLASAIRGGRIYDSWWKEAGSPIPYTDNPIWEMRDQPTINTRSGSDTWRCKECHGWDYKGVDGVYGNTTNSHYTGFPGVMVSVAKQPIDVYCAIHSGTGIHPSHNFSSELSSINILHLTKFLVNGPDEGLIDPDNYIDSTTGQSLGDSTSGQILYAAQNGCSSSNCHGVDGTAQREPLGDLSSVDPWLTLHKIRYGHPGAIMPAYADTNSTAQLSLPQMADVIAYIQTFTTTPGGGDGTTTPPVVDLDLIARGGRLYDNWIAETASTIPPVDNPIWALQVTNTRTGADTWRCNECHGWDYKGVTGVYGDANNSHYTGFAGVFSTEKTEAEIVTYLTSGFIYAPTGSTVHSFEGLLQPADIEALAKFIKLGTLDTSVYIAPSGIINGSAQNFQNGADLYSFKGSGVVNGNCALCHDLDGTGEPGVILGLVANENPWRTLHKVRFGQPATAMPSLINQIDPLVGTAAFDTQDAVDITHYSQSLPQQ